jgi:DnaK suppressor protein
MHDEQNELTPTQLAELERRLRRLCEELEGVLERSADEGKPVDLDEPIGRLSRIDAIAQREISQAGRRQQTQQLGMARSALLAIERGEYGSCRLCDEPIGYRRLQARPYSVICLTCQTQRETRG